MGRSTWPSGRHYATDRTPISPLEKRAPSRGSRVVRGSRGCATLRRMSSARLPHLTAKLQGFGTTIFAEMTALALRHDAVNLGQGFPDFDGPAFLKRAAIAAIEGGRNQYSRSHGLPEINSAISEHRRRFYGLEYDPDAEITVMHGATECIAATMLGLLDVGDEVVLFEPF